MFCWHKWSTWSNLERWTTIEGHVILRQTRYCLKCRKAEYNTID